MRESEAADVRLGQDQGPKILHQPVHVVVLERRDIAGGKARSLRVSDDGDRTSGHQLASNAGGSVAM